MKYILFILIFSNYCISQSNPKISILTCSTGDEIYSVFGHTAIRIQDESLGVDQVYNFGIFDFDTPNFALKFVNGRLKYQRGIQDMNNFILSYNYDNRLVREQVLNLSEADKRNFIDELRILYQPENREYTYSFLEKNCSTETRDLLSDIGVNFNKRKLDISHRELINSYLKETPWIRFGTDLLLGMPVDEKSSTYQSMFLPEYLEKGIDSATINGQPVVKSRTILNSVSENDDFKLSKWLSPFLIFSVIFLLLLFKCPKWAQISLSAIMGFVGIILVLLWMFSEHPEVKNNLNVLWCNPFYLLYIPLILQNKYSKNLTLFLSALLVVSILIWILGIQSFDIGVIPIMGILGLINFKRLGLKKQ